MAKDPVMEMLTMDEIRKLFKKNMRMNPSRQSIYNFIKTWDFPNNIGRGRPRLWHKAPVMAWFEARQKEGEI